MGQGSSAGAPGSGACQRLEPADPGLGRVQRAGVAGLSSGPAAGRVASARSSWLAHIARHSLSTAEHRLRVVRTWGPGFHALAEGDGSAGRAAPGVADTPQYRGLRAALDEARNLRTAARGGRGPAGRQPVLPRP